MHIHTGYDEVLNRKGMKEPEKSVKLCHVELKFKNLRITFHI